MRSNLWRRVRRGLAQYTRQHAIDPSRVGRVISILSHLVTFCGAESRSRKTLFRIGCALLEDTPHVITPVCPDYSHENGKYTYRGMGDGLPLSFQKHFPFLQRLVQMIPHLKVTVLIADHEGDLPEFRQSLGVTQEEFRVRIRGTRDVIKATVPEDWSVELFTEFSPDFLNNAWTQAQALLADARTRKRLETDTIMRARLYDQIGYPSEGRLERTAHVAGQYVCLGREIRARNTVVCNHTTTSLSWYGVAQAACLHNPVAIY